MKKYLIDFFYLRAYVFVHFYVSPYFFLCIITGYSLNKQTFMEETKFWQEDLNTNRALVNQDSLQKIKRFREQERLINDKTPLISVRGCVTWSSLEHTLPGTIGTTTGTRFYSLSSLVIIAPRKFFCFLVFFSSGSTPWSYLGDLWFVADPGLCTRNTWQPLSILLQK